MRVWSPLNARQVEILRRIEAADGAVLLDWADIALSVQALRNRRLTETSRSSEGWRATITDAGRYYLEHGEHPEKPRRVHDERVDQRSDHRPEALRRGAEDERSVDLLLEALDRGGGVLRISDPDQRERAAWRRVIHATKQANRVPAGFHLRHRGRDGGDLVVELVEGQHPDKKYRAPRAASGVAVEVPDEHQPLHRVAVSWGRGASVSEAALPRATRLVHALVVAAEGRGHKAQLSESNVGGLVVEARGAAFELVVEEEQDEVDRIEAPDPARDEKVYSWQRVRPRRVVEPSGRLCIGFASHDYRFSGRRQRWADRSRWTLNDKLGEVLAEIEARALILEERRRAEEAERARRQRAWEEAMALARCRFVEDRRRDRLLAQVDAWDEARRVRDYCVVLREVMATEPDKSRKDRLRGWLHWSQAYGESRDPTTWPDLAPDDPVPTEQDLEPYLDGWSPYGPDESPSRRHRSW